MRNVAAFVTDVLVARKKLNSIICAWRRRTGGGNQAELVSSTRISAQPGS